MPVVREGIFGETEKGAGMLGDVYKCYNFVYRWYRKEKR